MEKLIVVDKIIESIAIFSMIGLTFALLFYSFRRRQQNALHELVLGKFATAQDFSNFLQTPGGRQYLSNFSENLSNPGHSIVSSIRVGVILAVAGIGCFIPDRHLADVELPLTMIGTLLVFLGLGFLGSGGASYAISHRLGLLTKDGPDSGRG
jgi:hypothetical protein